MHEGQIMGFRAGNSASKYVLDYAQLVTHYLETCKFFLQESYLWLILKSYWNHHVQEISHNQYLTFILMLGDFNPFLLAYCILSILTLHEQCVILEVAP